MHGVLAALFDSASDSALTFPTAAAAVRYLMRPLSDVNTDSVFKPEGKQARAPARFLKEHFSLNSLLT